MENVITLEGISKAFTDKVQEYLSTGKYVFSISSMRGSQGELSKIDLKAIDNNHILRIMLVEDTASSVMDKITMYVKKYGCEQESSFSNCNTLWNSDGENQDDETVVFYQLSRGSSKMDAYTTDEDFAMEVISKQRKRRGGGIEIPRREIKCDKRALTRIVKNHDGYKSVTSKQVLGLFKNCNQYIVLIDGKKQLIVRCQH